MCPSKSVWWCCFAHVYKPLDFNVWPKSRNGKKTCRPNMLKLSSLQENKWEVGQALEATLWTPITFPPLGYGWIYCLLSRPPKNCKQYEIIISDYLAYNGMDLFSMMFVSLDEWGSCVQCKQLYYILQYVMFCVIRESYIHYPSWSKNEVDRLLGHAKVLELK
jgi:hypothetical protein